jgi:hypothetical protein
MTVDQADELVLAADPAFGAIEDAEARGTEIVYFFEGGQVGGVDRVSGAVTFGQG